LDPVALDQSTLEEGAIMVQIIGGLFEGLIRYCFLGVAFALLLMFFVFLLLQTRDWITNALKTEVLRMPFEKLFELSDRLDEKYVQDNIYGSAMWLTPLLWIGVASAVGLLILLIVVKSALG
jgi:type II secretory pathway component PulF